MCVCFVRKSGVYLLLRVEIFLKTAKGFRSKLLKQTYEASQKTSRGTPDVKLVQVFIKHFFSRNIDETSGTDKNPRRIYPADKTFDSNRSSPRSAM